MKKIKLLLAIIFLLTTSCVLGQIHNKKYIYYLLDTAKIPVRDRMVNYYVEHPFAVYEINCRCNPEHEDLLFLRKEHDKGNEIKKSLLKNINLVNLSYLINIAAAKKVEDFNNNYTLFFVESQHKKYIKYEVRLIQPLRRPPSDSISPDL